MFIPQVRERYGNTIKNPNQQFGAHKIISSARLHFDSMGKEINSKYPKGIRKSARDKIC